MKILNLKFNNINSMAGENRIDFDQPPLSDAGVFAITGPNGSGKSSILDAINGSGSLINHANRKKDNLIHGHKSRWTNSRNQSFCFPANV